MVDSDAEGGSVDKSLRVLHIISGDLWAGAEMQLMCLVSAQIKQVNIDPFVVLLNPGRLQSQLEDLAVSVTLLDENQMKSLSVLWRLIHEIKTLRPDVIHTHRIKENVLGSLAAVLAGRFSSIRTAHGMEEHRLHWHQIGKRIYRWLDWLCGRYFQKKIVAVSSDLGEMLCSRFSKRRVTVVRNGIDLDLPELQHARRKSQSAKPRSAIRIGIVGRLVPVKRVDLFITIARIFIERYPSLDTVFYVYGDGPQRRDLKAQSRLPGKESVVRFVGYVDAIYDEIASLDVLVMTSDHEGLPMTLLEAMALEVPIVARQVGGIPEVLDNGRFGSLVNSSQPDAFVQAIHTLINDKSKTREIAYDARTWVEDQYSSRKCAEQYQRIYATVCNARL